MCALLAVFAIQHRADIQNWISPPPPIQIPADFRAELLGTTWCQYCEKTRRFFSKNHIPFREYDVENSAEGRARYQRFNNGGVPIVIIGDTVIQGYDETAMREALAAVHTAAQR